MKRADVLTKVLLAVFVLGCGGGIGALLGHRLGAGLPKVVRAERFELVSPKTGARAVLSLGVNGNPQFSMEDGRGRGRVLLQMKDDGNPVLALFDKQHNSRASLSLSGDGTPGLRLSDSGRKKEFYATLGPDKGGCPWLHLSDSTGKVVWKAPTD